MRQQQLKPFRRISGLVAALATGALVASASITALADPAIQETPMSGDAQTTQKVEKSADALVIESTPAEQTDAPSTTVQEAPAVSGSELLQYVNPFIGTQDEGNTYPGATVPFGMVQASPDTGHSTGYDYTNKRVQGFSQVHLSGVGCSIAGMISTLPTDGYPNGTTDRGDDRYSMAFIHGQPEVNDGYEFASPGYYQVGLLARGDQKGISAEMTATTRTSVQRYTFKPGIDPVVRINPGQAMSRVESSSVKVDKDAGTVEAVSTVRGFCQDTSPFTVYSITKFNQPITEFRTWVGDTLSTNATASSTDRTGAALKFASGSVVEAQTAISYVDMDGARANLQAEASTFDNARTAAEGLWSDWLGRIKVSGGDSAFLKPFYSAWYRTGLGPNTANDVDGRYRGWDTKIHNVSEQSDEPNFTYYQNFSLWDTYRSQGQTLGLFEPQRAKDIMRSLITQGEQYWAPRWGYGPVETNIMTGDPITPFLTSAYKQGLLSDELAERAYNMLKENVDVGSDITDLPHTGLVVDQTRAKGANGRLGNPDYLVKGYIPWWQNWVHVLPGDQDPMHAASASIEYALADASMAELAHSLGHDEDAARYALRGQNFRNLWNADLKAFQPRMPNGLFYPLDNAVATRGFHEGTTVQYEWLVPQDPAAVVTMMGGKDETIKRLDDFFAYDNLVKNPSYTSQNDWVVGAYDYYNRSTYNPNNEPNLAAPFSYAWVGQPWKTADVVRAALALYTNGPTGVKGNDDLGEMASWTVLNALGLFSVAPGTNVWGLTSPVWDRIELTIPDVKTNEKNTVVITAPGESNSNRYVQSVKVNGENLDKTWITEDALRGADRTIEYQLGDKPSGWATSGDNMLPPGLFKTQAIREVQVPDSEVIYAGNDFAQVKLSVTGEGTVEGAVTVSGDVLAEPSTANWKAKPNGGTQEIVVAVPIKLASSAPTAYSNITVSATTDGATSTRQSTKTVGFSRMADNVLASQFNKKSIGKSYGPNDGMSMDSSGYNHLQDALAGVGFIEGRSLQVPGKGMTFAARAADPLKSSEKDSVNNKVVNLPLGDSIKDATKIALVGSAPNGPRTVSVTLKFGNGTSIVYPVTFADWCSKPGSTETLLAAPAFRGSGDRKVQEITCNITASSPINVYQGRGGLSSISISSDQRLHIYAIASDGSQPLLQVAQDSGVEVEGKPMEGQVLKASDVKWAVAPGVTPAGDLTTANARTTYQWYRDGIAILGATSNQYTPTADDVDATISVAATGWLPGMLSGESRAPAGVIAKANVVVTPQAPSQVGHTVKIPSLEGVEYRDASNNVLTGDILLAPEQTLTVVAVAKSGFEFAAGTEAQWEFKGADMEVVRHGGATRYDTSFEVAREVLVAGKPLFVATGLNFPDALAGGAAAAHTDGALILVGSKVPDATLALLGEKKPSEVYVLGGSGAVSELVVSQLQTATGVTPVRLSGKNRFETASKVASTFFTGATCAYVASGDNFPDALAASGKAGRDGCPIILFGRGTADLPATASSVFIVGGKGVIPEAYKDKLDHAGMSVTRLAGVDRYATSQQLMSEDAAEVWVANGFSFPDALSAAAPSGKSGATMVLAKTNCIPLGAKPAIGANTIKVHLVGGNGALNQNVAALKYCDK